MPVWGGDQLPCLAAGGVLHSFCCILLVGLSPSALLSTEGGDLMKGKLDGGVGVLWMLTLHFEFLTSGSFFGDLMKGKLDGGVGVLWMSTLHFEFLTSGSSFLLQGCKPVISRQSRFRSDVAA